MSYLIHGYPLWQWLAIDALFMLAGAAMAAYPVWRLAERAYRPAGRHAYHAPEPDPDPPPQPGHDDTVAIYADITGPIPRVRAHACWAETCPNWPGEGCMRGVMDCPQEDPERPLDDENDEDDPDWVSRLPAEEPIEWAPREDPYLTRLTAETEADVLRAMIRLDEDASAFMAARAVEFEATRSMLALAGPR